MYRNYSKNALSNAKNLRKNQTDAESLLWFRLKNRNLANIKFKRQVPIGEYIVDFVCQNKKLVIELDGSQHLDNIEYDANRTRYLTDLGYHVVRIFNNDIFSNIEIVLDFILSEYNRL